MPPASAWTNITIGTIALAIIGGLIYLAGKYLDRKPETPILISSNGYEARIKVLESEFSRVNREVEMLRAWRHDMGNKAMLAIIAIHEQSERR